MYGMRYGSYMAAVQVRDLSPDAHRRLKARAALSGQSLSEYLRIELERLASFPTISELSERIQTRGSVGGMSGAELVRADRDERA
jgi:antitoxin FitA